MRTIITRLAITILLVNLRCCLSILPKMQDLLAGLERKLYRLANLESSGKVALNESIDDTERDILTIVALWIASRRESRYEPKRENLSQTGNPRLSLDAEELPTSSNRTEVQRTGDTVRQYECNNCREGVSTKEPNLFPISAQCVKRENSS